MEERSRNFATDHSYVLMKERNFDYNDVSFPNVYIIGYDQEGKDEVYDMLKSISGDSSEQKITVNLVEGSFTRSNISKEFCIAIKKIRKIMRIKKGISVAFLMVLNPNIHSRGQAEKARVTELIDVIGPEILIRCALVLKDGTERFEGGSLRDHYNDVVSMKTCMCDLYAKLYPRIIAIDFGEGSESVDDQKKEQMLSLLHATGAGFDTAIPDNNMRAIFCLVGLAFGLVFGTISCILATTYLPK